jgi:hypothetical protein
MAIFSPFARTLGPRSIDDKRRSEAHDKLPAGAIKNTRVCKGEAHYRSYTETRVGALSRLGLDDSSRSTRNSSIVPAPNARTVSRDRRRWRECDQSSSRLITVVQMSRVSRRPRDMMSGNSRICAIGEQNAAKGASDDGKGNIATLKTSAIVRSSGQGAKINGVTRGSATWSQFAGRRVHALCSCESSAASSERPR